MNRRSFLASILALGAAPAIVRADSLMRVVARETEIVVPTVNEVAMFAHGNRLLSIETITRQALAMLEQQIKFSKSFQMVTFEGAGRTLRIKSYNTRDVFKL
jgi:DMSO reductase anchor subunit